VIDGYTGDQRFFLAVRAGLGGQGAGQTADRVPEVRSHSPYAARGSLPLSNQDAFYTAFGLKPGDKMYLPPDKRVHIW